MAEAETTQNRQEELIKKYNVRHHYRGTWKMDGDDTIYQNKSEALKAAAAREVAEQVEDEVGDVIPKGYERYDLTENRLVRGSIMELPMNEPYTAEGTHNPSYDREWVYAWAYQDRSDIASYRAKGFHPVEPKEFRASVKEGRIPQYVGDLVYEEGSFMAYGDSVLMRAPRFLWRQQKAAALQKSQTALGMQQTADADRFARAGVGLSDSYASKLNLENSLDIVEV